MAWEKVVAVDHSAPVNLLPPSLPPSLPPLLTHHQPSLPPPLRSLKDEERAKLCVALAYATHSLYYMFLRTKVFEGGRGGREGGREA